MDCLVYQVCLDHKEIKVLPAYQDWKDCLELMELQESLVLMGFLDFLATLVQRFFFF